MIISNRVRIKSTLNYYSYMFAQVEPPIPRPMTSMHPSIDHLSQPLLKPAAE